MAKRISGRDLFAFAVFVSLHGMAAYVSWATFVLVVVTYWFTVWRSMVILDDVLNDDRRTNPR